MPDYPNYKVNGRAINDILEYSENRSNTSQFNEYKHSNNIMTFASFNSYYHPFSFNTKINDYFANKNTSINKGCAAKGFAPLLNVRYETSNDDGGKEVIIKYKGTGNPLDFGKLKIEKSGSSYEIDCPTCIVLGLIGAGGGGAGGGGWYTGKEAFGGGCAALVALHIEMPYTKTDYVDVLRINLGAGGSGGGAWNNGSNGGATTLDFYYENEWHRIAYINGGKGGQNQPINTAHAPSTDLAISLAFLETVDKDIYGSQGNGRITIVNNVRQWSWGKGNYSYMPGNYYAGSMDDSYNQVYYSFGKLTSGSSYSNSYIYYPGAITTGYYDKYTTIAKNHNRWWLGKYSVYGAGGSIGESSSGGTGGIGAGGGAGCPATNIFDGGIGKGGRGGAAGLKLYW
jgi:hypothetical protein